MNISENITYDEATFSQTANRTGIENIPSGQDIEAMRNIAENVFEPLRKVLGNKPIKISSFFRSKALNVALPGASDTSQHCTGEAMDIKCGKAGFEYIRDYLEYDQLIWEYGTDLQPAWVHVSLKIRGKNRKQVLRKKQGQPYTILTK